MPRKLNGRKSNLLQMIRRSNGQFFKLVTEYKKATQKARKAEKQLKQFLRKVA